MDAQQIVTLGLVGVAGIYLVRVGRQAWKAMWAGKSGCGSGCSKCPTAEIAARKMSRSNAASQPANMIPLAAVRRAPSKRDE